MTTTHIDDAARWATGLELIVASRSTEVHVTLRDEAGWEVRAHAEITASDSLPPTVTPMWVRERVQHVVHDLLVALSMAALQAHEGRSSFLHVLDALTAQAVTHVDAVWEAVERIMRDELARRGVPVVEDDTA
jgi:Arc/MetJ family transcription regulator